MTLKAKTKTKKWSLKKISRIQIAKKNQVLANGTSIACSVKTEEMLCAVKVVLTQHIKLVLTSRSLQKLGIARTAKKGLQRSRNLTKAGKSIKVHAWQGEKLLKRKSKILNQDTNLLRRPYSRAVQAVRYQLVQIKAHSNNICPL